MHPEPRFLRLAVALAAENVRTGLGGPFGAVVVRDGVVVAQAANTVTATNDPTAHAEVNAIRAACSALGVFELSGCDLYCSCEPCPMCLAAILWARCNAVYFGCGAADAAEAGFDDQRFYDEMCRPAEKRSLPMTQLLRDEAMEPFALWQRAMARTIY